MGVEVADLFVVLRAVSDPFSKGLKNAAADAESSSKRMTSALAGVAKVGAGVAVGLTGIAVESVKMAATFNAQMTLLQTQAGVSKTQIASLSSGVLSLAGQVGFSPTSLAEALFHVESSFASTGISGSQALNLLKVAAEGAATGHANLVDVTNALDAAVVSGIPGVQNLSEAMGELNATVGAGDMTMQDLANAFSTGLLANVKSYGLTFRDVGAALAVFGDNNMRGQLAATDLRMAVQAISKPAATASVELQKMGLDADSLRKVMSSGGLLPALQLLHERMTKIGVTAKDQGAVLTDLFGKKAGAGIVVLYDQLGRLESKYPDLDKGASGFADAWTTTKATIAQQFKEIEAGADALFVRLGNDLIPQLSKLISTAGSDFGQLGSGFTGADRKVTSPGAGSAFMNRELSTAPKVTEWQRFGEEVRQVLTDVERGAVRLEPVGKDLVRFGDDVWQSLEKIAHAAEPVAHDLGVGLFGGAELAGKALANVLGPPIKFIGDFIGSHETLFRVFADVILGGIAAKMVLIGGINAAEGIVNLATAIVQFPLGQANQITSALDGVKVAFTGKDAKAGEDAVKGLKGAVGDLKGSMSGLLDKVPALDGVRLKLAGVKDGVSGVEKAASDTSKVEKLGADLEGAATGGGKAATSIAGLAGSLGKAAGPLALILGGTGLLGNYLGHLAGVGDHTAQGMDQLAQVLQLAGAGSTQAADQFTKTAVALADMQSVLNKSRSGIMGFGSFGSSQVQGLKDMDAALTNLVTGGHAQQAEDQFNATAAALAKQGINAQQAASYFPGYEKAIKNAGDSAATMDGQVQGLLSTLAQQQATEQFNTDLNNLSGAIMANGKELQGNSQSAIANRQAFEAAASDIENYYVQQRNAAVPIAQATATMQSQVDQLEKTGIQAGFTKNEVDAYLKQLGMIPSKIATSVTLNLDTGGAYRALNDLIQTIDSSVGYVQVTGTGGGMYGGGRAYTNADGGPVRKGDLSWVGERGPELVVFGHDGYVVPNEALTGRRPVDSRVLSGMGGLGIGSAGYVPGFSSGGASVVNNYYVTNHVAGTVLSQIELDALVRKLVQQHKTRNSTTGMN
jgi:TP901 family phage tail tape measure protein